MKTLRFTLVAFCITLFMSCNTTPQYHLKGTLSGQFENDYNGKTVYLLSKPNSEAVKLDSCVIVNNEFSFVREVKEPNELRWIEYTDFYSPLLFIEEEGEINIKIGDNGRTIGGTAANDSYQQFTDSLYALFVDSHIFVEELTKLQNTGELSLDKYKECDMKMEAYMNMLEDYVLDYITSHIDKPIAKYMVYEDTYFFTHPKKVKDIIDKVIKDSKSPQEEKSISYIDSALATSVGQQYKNVEGVNIVGEEVSLSNHIGRSKVVLVEFWASWCGPCRDYSPVLKQLLTKYKTTDLRVIGVTLDERKEDWIRATKEDSITWSQIAPLGKIDVGRLYGFRGIPYTMLIDDKGVIRERGTFSDIVLDKKIQALLEE